MRTGLSLLSVMAAKTIPTLSRLARFRPSQYEYQGVAQFGRALRLGRRGFGGSSPLTLTNIYRLMVIASIF